MKLPTRDTSGHDQHHDQIAKVAQCGSPRRPGFMLRASIIIARGARGGGH